MKLKLAILLSVIYLSSFAQNKVLDSLLKVSKNQKGEIYINTLNEISWEYKNSNIDSALFYAQKSLIISTKLKNKKAIASSFNSLANCYEAIGKLDSSRTYHQKSLDIQLQIKNMVGAADSYNNLGIVFDLQGDFDLSLKSYFKALKIYENEKVEFDKIPMVLVNIGIVYKKQKQYDKVLDYYRRALKIYEDNKYEFGVVLTKGNIGSVSLYLKDYNNAIKYSKEAQDLYVKLGYERYVPYMLNNIAIAKDSLQLNSEAQDYYKKAINLFEKDQNLYELCYAQIGLANSYKKGKRFEDASKVLKSALEVINKKGFKALKTDAYKLMAAIEAQLGNYKVAFDYYNLYAKGKDSLLEENKIKTIFELDTKYRSEKNEKEISQQKEQLLKNEIQIKNKNLFAILLAAGLLILGIITFGLFKRHQHKRREYLNQLELKEVQTYSKLQDQRLRISRDLHDNIGSQLTFIISSIDNLNFLTKKSNEKLRMKLSEINEFASSTITQLRDTIWAMNKNEITFEDFQGRILTFIEKAKTIATKIHFNFNSTVKSNIIFSSIKGINIFRVLQEATNNTIKYANASEISIEISENENELFFIISDNGKGFDINKIELGNGLENMQRRIQEIDGAITINSEINKGTTITITCLKNRSNAV
ncbi:sensor histidine kinase [Lutibacter sp.]|uniref:tetratricopeptide repeat-containing sensor histidine kinase n=1 Tax=Lutibacter sp. TaxID=1925666 RepID=UPI0027333E21|nr:sensor histidine kinase [Lutibacter sp.]MDP3313678.1 sensor histidine kinase [Lutibacter sp.]